jgi:hypothetical protein
MDATAICRINQTKDGNFWREAWSWHQRNGEQHAPTSLSNMRHQKRQQHAPAAGQPE